VQALAPSRPTQGTSVIPAHEFDANGSSNSFGHHVRVAEKAPTEAERRAVQKAVDAGDMKRAQELLGAIRRRLSRLEKGPKKRSSVKARSASKRKNSRPVRRKSRQSPSAEKPTGAAQKAPLPEKQCIRCGAQFKPSSGREKLCSLCRPGRNNTSVRTISGGLPGLGKRR